MRDAIKGAAVGAAVMATMGCFLLAFAPFVAWNIWKDRRAVRLRREVENETDRN